MIKWIGIIIISSGFAVKHKLTFSCDSQQCKGCENMSSSLATGQDSHWKVFVFFCDDFGLPWCCVNVNYGNPNSI